MQATTLHIKGTIFIWFHFLLVLYCSRILPLLWAFYNLSMQSHTKKNPTAILNCARDGILKKKQLSTTKDSKIKINTSASLLATDQLVSSAMKLEYASCKPGSCIEWKILPSHKQMELVNRSFHSFQGYKEKQFWMKHVDVTIGLNSMLFSFSIELFFF